MSEKPSPINKIVEKIRTSKIFPKDLEYQVLACTVVLALTDYAALSVIEFLDLFDKHTKDLLEGISMMFVWFSVGGAITYVAKKELIGHEEDTE